MSISAHLIPTLRERFPGRGMRIIDPVQPPVPRRDSAQPCAVFPGIHPEVGNIEIFDDGDELTLVVGNFTHGHFSNFDDDLNEEQKAEAIVGDVIQFLDDVFADRVVFWGSHDALGGWKYRGGMQTVRPVGTSHSQPPVKQYVWSGPQDA